MVEVAAWFVVVLVLMVERLQREAPVCLLASTATLRYVRIILSHGFRLVDLQLRVEALQFRLQRKETMHSLPNCTYNNSLNTYT